MRSALVLLSGFVPIPHLYHAASAASDTGTLAVQATVLKQLQAEATGAINVANIVPTQASGSAYIDAANGVTMVDGGQFLSSGAPGGLQFGGSEINIQLQANLGTAGLKLLTASGATGITISKVYITANSNGLTKQITLSKGSGTNNTATANLQGSGNGAHGVGARITWAGSPPALGTYSGTLSISIDRL